MRKTSYSDSNSSFWLDNDFFQDDQYDMLGEELAKPKGKDPMKLAGYRRAIGNFVRSLIQVVIVIPMVRQLPFQHH